MSPSKLPGAQQQEQGVLRGYLEFKIINVKKYSWALGFYDVNFLEFLVWSFFLIPPTFCSRFSSLVSPVVLAIMRLVIIPGVITSLAWDWGDPRWGRGSLPGQREQWGGEGGADEAGQPGEPEDYQDGDSAENHEGGRENHFEQLDGSIKFFSPRFFSVYAFRPESGRWLGETDWGVGSRQPRRDIDICNKRPEQRVSGLTLLFYWVLCRFKCLPPGCYLLGQSGLF